MSLYCFLFSGASGIGFKSTRALDRSVSVRTMRRRRAMKPPQSQSRIEMRRTNSARRQLTLALSLAIVLVASGVVLRLLQRSWSGFSFTKKGGGGDVDLSDPQEKKHRVKYEDKLAPVFKVHMLAEYPHDGMAFTQGLAYATDGYLYESTGLYGHSSLRRTEITTGNVLDLTRLADDEFGEGLTLASRDAAHILQVLWKVGRGYVYDRATLTRLSTFNIGGEAWGITETAANSNEFFLSNGSSTIQVFTLAEGGKVHFVRSFTVRDGPYEVGLLNELEIVRGELWANIFMADCIARIDTRTGKVNSWLDLRGILQSYHLPKNHRSDVLNGIAYNPTDDVVYVTGKLWPKVFSVRPSSEIVAKSVRDVLDPFFLDPSRVEYIHRYVIA